MALYAYKAMNGQGRTVMGRLEAINLIDLEMRLKRMDLDFINGDAVRQGGLFNQTRITRPELINFCFHLEQLARAGVSLNKLFNTSGVQYRELKIKEQLPALSEQEILALLAGNGRLIKRPLITDGKRATVGFDAERFAAVWC